MQDLLAILKQKAAGRKIMMHCFTGTPAEAAEVSRSVLTFLSR